MALPAVPRQPGHAAHHHGGGDVGHHRGARRLHHRPDAAPVLARRLAGRAREEGLGCRRRGEPAQPGKLDPAVPARHHRGADGHDARRWPGRVLRHRRRAGPRRARARGRDRRLDAQPAHRPCRRHRLPGGRRPDQELARVRPGGGPVADAPAARAHQAQPGHAALRHCRDHHRRGGRLGGGPQRAPAGAPAHRSRRGHRPHRAAGADPGRGRRRDRPARVGVQPDAGLARRVSRSAAPPGRRRRPRAADATHLAAHQHRPAHPGRGRAAARHPRRAALRRTRPARGAVHPGRRPGRAGPRRARSRPSSAPWSSTRCSTTRSPASAAARRR